MRRFALALVLLAILSSAAAGSDRVVVIIGEPGVVTKPMFTWGCPRDLARFDGYFPAPCAFPRVESPCAIPCRVPGLRHQVVPKPVVTACHSKKMPCHGFIYGANPYPLFQ